MQEVDCVRFLQWALPHLQMRWAGFRKVRKQVCKRLVHRLAELGITDIDAYQHYFTQTSGKTWTPSAEWWSHASIETRGYTQNSPRGYCRT
jgi:hypothetical protein